MKLISIVTLKKSHSQDSSSVIIELFGEFLNEHTTDFSYSIFLSYGLVLNGLISQELVPEQLQ